MFKKLLVPTDGSPLSEQAATAAVQFAAETGAALVAVSVAESFPYPIGAEGGVVPDMTDYENALRTSASRYAERIAEMARAKDVPCTTVCRTGYSAAAEIVAAAREQGCDLIWMGSHGRSGVERMLMGSQTRKVLARASLPVLVFPMKK